MTQCASWSYHCMVPAESGVIGAEQSVCCDSPGGGQHFSDVYRFNPTDTRNHQCCFVSVRNETGGGCDPIERDEGRYCGYGCIMCDDQQLDQMVDDLDGQRWLRAEERFGQRYWDARGLIHDLRSNEYHPIPGAIMYERGSCWENNPAPDVFDGGRECFQEDACACFGVNSPIYPGEASSTRGAYPWNCGLGTAGELVPGLLPDPFFRTGYRWPPSTMQGARGSNYQGMERLYCRKFSDARLPFPAGGGHDFMRVLISPTKTGGLSGVTEPMLDPVLMSSNVCNSDRMVGCTARMGTNSECLFHSMWGELTRSYPDADPALAFYNQHQPSRNRFNYLSIDSDNTAILLGPPDREGLGGRSTKWKNDVLEAIKTEEFWTAEERVEQGQPTATSINFARLDHMHPLEPSGSDWVGVYRREWGGARIIPKTVPNGSGQGRLRMSGCTFDYKTVLTHVKIECRLILPQVKEWGDDYYIEPLVRFHIIGVVSIMVSNLRSAEVERGLVGPCWVDSWQSGRERQRTYLDVYNRPENGGSTPEVWVIPEPRDWPGPDERPGQFDPLVGVPWDQAESFIFLDDEGKQFIPDRLVEWRGFLGEHSEPKAWHQRIMLEAAGGSCDEVAERFSTQYGALGGIVVPGWPTHADSHPDDPQQVYGGHIRLNFTG